MIISLGSEIDLQQFYLVARCGGKSNLLTGIFQSMIDQFQYKLMQSKSKQKRMVRVRRGNK